MKKGVAWILLLIICLSWTVSLADTSKELTFQDVPWFSSPEEASKILVKSGFVKRAFGKKNFEKEIITQGKKKIKQNAHYHSLIGNDPENEDCPYTIAINKPDISLTRKLEKIGFYSTRDLPKTIAKRKLMSFSLLFTPDQKNPQLVEISIWLMLGSDDDVIEALREAYGEETSINLSNPYKECYVWLGANNTIVIYDCRDDYVSIATLDGLALAETYDVKFADEPEDTGF